MGGLPAAASDISDGSLDAGLAHFGFSIGPQKLLPETLTMGEVEIMSPG